MIDVEDLGLMPYRQAWAYQESLHAQVLAGRRGRLLLVEHPPVITLGRRPGVVEHLLASESWLAQNGIDRVESDRGGDITFHGPGQLVVYPVLRLLDYRLSVSGYVRLLERVVIDTLAVFGIAAQRAVGAVGVWTPEEDGSISKICAIGVRIRRGATLHGLALNVTTDLRYFELIVPCGLTGRKVTSLVARLGSGAPSMAQVKAAIVEQFRRALTSELPAEIAHG